jgi:hypothetical protein
MFDGTQQEEALISALEVADTNSSDWYQAFRTTPGAPASVNSSLCQQMFIQSQCIFFNYTTVPLCFPNGTVGALPCFGSCVSYYVACFGASVLNASEPCLQLTSNPDIPFCYGTPSIQE